MAKKPDTPCAGGCGTLLWSGGSSLPPGTRTCRPCRASRPKQVRRRPSQECTFCGKVFHPTKSTGGRSGPQRTCSHACSRGLRRVDKGVCASCEALLGEGSVLYCVPCQLARRRAGWRRKNAIRRGAVRAGRQISIQQLGDRDGWRCHLCRRKVDRALRCPDPMSPTFDHLVPISDGGTDDPANVLLAHRYCNTSRGTRGVVQLMLVG